MKNTGTPLRRLSMKVAIAVIAAAGFIGSGGCDTEPAQDFSISVWPPSVSLRNGETQVFTASGGLRYNWSVAQPVSTETWGVLNAFTGDSVIYTSVRSPSNASVIATITVTSTLGGTGDTTNSTGGLTATAVAYVYHIP